jgi:hypothetical protein
MNKNVLLFLVQIHADGGPHTKLWTPPPDFLPA